LRALFGGPVSAGLAEDAADTDLVEIKKVSNPLMTFKNMNS
jgi:hypothetical protein